MENRDIILFLGLGVVGYYIYNKTKGGSKLNVNSFVEENLSNVTSNIPTNIPVAPRQPTPIPIPTALTAPTAPIPMPTAAPATTTKYTYPEGIGKDGKKFELNDGDYVANGEETAILYQGKLRPMTAAYANKFAAGTWERTKIIDNIVYSSIPRGAVLDV
jgi:hypothetical protein